MAAPFFSVIIPVFNRAPALRRAIGSVLAQSCQDFEIVVVDDGSRDDPESVAESFGDPRIRFIRQGNEGGGVARNTAIDAAIGRYVAPLDSDDVFLPHHLAAMKAMLEGSHDLAGYARVVVDRGDGKTFLKPPRGVRPDEDMGEYLLCDRGFVPTITIVVPRAMAQRVRYHVNLRPAEDTDFAMRLALAGCRFQMVEEPGAVWSDIPDPRRTSASAGTLRFATWLKQMKPRMSQRAWHGARGWAFAKLVARERGRLPALAFTLEAILRGCYRPSMAMVVLLQVLLTPAQYRSLADHGIRWLRLGLREPQAKAAGAPGLELGVISRRTALGGALALPARAQELRALKSLAAAKGFVFGTAAASYELKDADFPPLLLSQAGQLVPEYEMKRQVLEPRPGQRDFSGLDLLFGFARRNGLTLRGHPLVWYYANPPWLKTALAARRDESLMTGHIEAILRRYPLSSVDVVNEAILPDGSGLRPSLWLDAFGPGYIDMAFHAARAANPKTRLVYNDFGCEPGPNHLFRKEQLKLLDGLLARGVPVDALGLQGHLSCFGKKVDQKKLQAFLTEVQSRGLAILVTELDVDDTGGPSDIAARDRAVADETRRFLDVVLDSPALVAVLTWNLSDRYCDPPDEAPLKAMGWRYRKTPYDAGLKPKPMWDAMARAFSARPVSY